MQKGSGPSKKSGYWTRGADTSRHVYFLPSGNRAGQALFILIALLGLVALIVGARHLMGAAAFERRDVVLAIVGLFTTLLGVVQAIRLRR